MTFDALPRLLRLAGARRITSVALATIAVAASEGAGLALLLPIIAALDGRVPAIAGWQLPQLSLTASLALFVALVALRAAAELWRSLAVLGAEVAVVDGLRSAATRALLHADWRVLSPMRQAGNRALLITGIDRVGEATLRLGDLARSVVLLCAMGLAAFAIAPLAALAGGAFAALSFLLLASLRRRARDEGEVVAQAYDAIHARHEEALDNLRLIKSAQREDATQAGIAATIAVMRKSERSYLRDWQLSRAGLQIAAALALAIALALAARGGTFDSARFAILAAIAIRAVPLLEALHQALQGWIHAGPALAEVEALTAHAQRHAEAQDGDVAAPVLRKQITLERVGLAHDEGRIALAAVTAAIPARGITALTGPSGAGKSTLADLVGGLVAPDEGSVRIDGTMLDGPARRAWRSRVAYVQQEPVLFAGSIRSNLLWAQPDADDAALLRALERAGAAFVPSLPQGIDTPVGERGRQLSGGERQRIALARALLREPDLLILDEATSAVDAESEAAIVSAVREIATRCCVIVIGHRGALVDCADRTINLENGRVVAS